MGSLRAIVELIRENASWTPSATSRTALPQSARGPSLWVPEDETAENGTAAGGGIFSAVTSVLSGSIWGTQKAAETVENVLRGVRMRESDHAEGEAVPVKRLQDVLNRLSHRYGTLMQTRDEMLEVHTKVQMEWAKCADIRRFYLESQQRFMDQAETFLLAQDPVGAMELLRQLHRQTQADLSAMSIQADITRNLEDRLSSIHFQLLRRDEAFFKSCHAIMSLRPLSPATEKQIAASAVKVQSSSASQESNGSGGNALHPTLESYYDKAGSVGLIGEELANLDIEYEEARSVRLFLAERDDSPDLSNSKFEENYMSGRAQIEQKLSLAIQEANMLRERCVAEGLDLAEREKAQSEGTDDVLLNRSSEGLASEGVGSRHALHKNLGDWVLVGRESLLRGPVLRDPDGAFDPNLELSAPESTDDLNHAQRTDVLQWASEIPDEVEHLDPNFDEQEPHHEPDKVPEFEQSNLWEALQLMF